MAFTLIEPLSGPSGPASYSDEYREALMSVIEAKLQGQELLEPPALPHRAVELMAALRASVEAAGNGKKASARPPKRRWVVAVRTLGLALQVADDSATPLSQVRPHVPR